MRTKTETVEGLKVQLDYISSNQIYFCNCDTKKANENKKNQQHEIPLLGR